MRIVHSNSPDNSQHSQPITTTSTTSFHGFKSTPTSEVSNLCSDGQWSEVTLQRSHSQVATAALMNLGIGLGSMATIGMGLMACTAPPPAIIFCAVGAAGAMYGMGLIVSTPLNHTGFQTNIDVKWHCLQ